MRFGIILILFFSIPVLTSCTTYDFAGQITQQGNLLPQSKVNQVRVGMTKHEVAILLGHSLIETMFNQDRWDYAYTWHRRGHSDVKKHVVIFFKNGFVSQIDKNP